MQLQRLTGLERQKILDEMAELLKTIERLRAVLSSHTLLMRTIVDELRAVQCKYGDVRRSQIIEETGEFRVEDLIAEEDMAITVSNTGYIKRTPITTYRNQRRGGKGRIGMRTREEDFVSHLFIASTHAYIMIFSDRGRAYWLKVHEIPDVGPGGKGKAIANLVLMDPDERIAALLAVKEFEFDKFIVMGTQRGVIKKTELIGFSNPRAGGIIAMGVEQGDRVMAVRMTDGQGEIFIGTRDGMAIRFPESDVRAVGRAAYGVRGINLREDDQVVAMEVVKPFDQAQGEPSGTTQERAAVEAAETPFDSVRAGASEAQTVARDKPVGGTLLTVTENGYGKRTEIDEYRVQSRGGVGIINIQTTERNGRVVGIALVYNDDEVLLISQQGKILRMTARNVRTIGRATQGVRLIDIDPDDRVVSVARLAEKEEEDKNADFDA
jgi:DNA gyrase subunit A